MNFYPILFFMIVDGEVESKRDESDFEEEIKDRISVLRRCGQILETELITKDGLNDCMSRTILHRAKRSLKCYACQKTSLFITKEVSSLGKLPQNWKTKILIAISDIGILFSKLENFIPRFSSSSTTQPYRYW